ncbi:MAG: TRAP transporter substrate-binding protein [Rhodospirillales bacterium]|nr:TRAP transporter substrate-binding protein [Rhodospirillales bacterium]
MGRTVVVVLALLVGAAGGFVASQWNTEEPTVPGAETAGGTGIGGAGDVAPIRWKMASAFGSQWPIQGELGIHLVEQVDRVTGGTLKIQFFEPNALVPPLEMFDAVSQGSIDAAWASAGLWAGKIPALQFFTAVPFGPGIGEYLGWLYADGAEKTYRDLYVPHGIHAMHCGLHSPEGSGWFREEIRSIEDLRGLKMRFFGLGARVMEKLGVSTQLLAGGDIFPALELGAIDAAEYSMPVIDLNQGFYQVAKHYYFPGWHQQTSLFELLVSDDRWNELSLMQQAQIEMVCEANFVRGAAIGEAAQSEALAELADRGVQFHRWSPEILDAMREGWKEVVAEESAKDADFARVAEAYFDFHERYRTWAEYGYLR